MSGDAEYGPRSRQGATDSGPRCCPLVLLQRVHRVAMPEEDRRHSLSSSGARHLFLSPKYCQDISVRIAPAIGSVSYDRWLLCSDLRLSNKELRAPPSSLDICPALLRTSAQQ